MEPASFTFMTAVTICSDFGAPKNEVCHCFHCFLIYLPWSDGIRCQFLIFECWVLSQLFHSLLSLSSSSSLVPLHFLPWGWCHLHIWGYLFILAILIPACISSSLTFCMMYSAYKLNKQSEIIQLWHTRFPSLGSVYCSMSSSNCCFLTCIQVSQETGKVVWYSHLLKNFPVCCNPHSQRL